MKKISRRDFLYCGAGLLACTTPAYALWPFSDKTESPSIRASIPASMGASPRFHELINLCTSMKSLVDHCREVDLIREYRCCPHLLCGNRD